MLPPANIQLEAHVTGHDGEDLDEGFCFFTEPPTGLGKLVSVGSNLRIGESQVRQSGQAKSTFLWLLGLLLPLFMLAVVLGLSDFQMVVVIIVGLVAAVFLSLRVGKVQPCVTFLGAEGIAMAKLRGSNCDFQTLLFKDAVEFYSREDVFISEGHYAGSAFWNSWRDSSDRELMVFNGAHYAESDMQSGMEDLEVFSKVARRVWFELDYERRLNDLRTTGRVSFTLSDFGVAVVKDNCLELTINGKVDRISDEDVQKAELVDGKFVLSRKDSSAMTSRGHHSFALHYISCSDNFIRMVKEIAGITIQ